MIPPSHSVRLCLAKFCGDVGIVLHQNIDYPRHSEPIGRHGPARVVQRTDFFGFNQGFILYGLCHGPDRKPLLPALFLELPAKRRLVFSIGDLTSLPERFVRMEARTRPTACAGKVPRKGIRRTCGPLARQPCVPQIDRSCSRPRWVNVKRSISFVIVLLILAGLSAGLGYFQFVVKPQMIKQFIAQAGPLPRPSRSSRRAPRPGRLACRRSAPSAPCKASRSRRRSAAVITAVKVESGQDVRSRHAALRDRQFGRAGRSQNNLATLKNADLAFERQRKLTLTGNTAKANVDSAEAARDSAAAAVRARPRVRSPRRTSSRPLPVGSASARSISVNMSRRARASSLCRT